VIPSVLGAALALANPPAPVGASPPVSPIIVVGPDQPNAPNTQAGTDQAAPVAPPASDDIVVSAGLRNVPGDPLRALNATSFEVTQVVDTAVVRPAAIAYRRIVPEPIRSGVRNFLTNIGEPIVVINFLLQLKPGKALETAARFFINSTYGVAGIFDFAKRRAFKLPHRPNGFADTLGFYGVKSGPFLFLPLVGPTTVRDLIGLSVDRLVVPFAAGKPFNQPVYTVPAGTLGSLDQRAQFDADLQKLHDSADGPYTATREDYLARRQAEIDTLRGKPSKPAPAAPAAPPPGPVGP
jgi:phospholipid-binding lipoprotein MlaA